MLRLKICYWTNKKKKKKNPTFCYWTNKKKKKNPTYSYYYEMYYLYQINKIMHWNINSLIKTKLPLMC